MRTAIPLLALLSCAVAQAPAPVVDVGNAKYQGTVNAATNISSYFGIRYAAAPIGDLRFRAPQSPPTLAGVQKATAKPQHCLQAPSGKSPTNPYPRSTLRGRAAQDPEDCLFLNVHFPGSTIPARPLPVIVWIHGGGYISGGAASFNGDDLIVKAKNGVVVVVIQYRLGIFGFLSSSQVKANGALNAGLRGSTPVHVPAPKRIRLSSTATLLVPSTDDVGTSQVQFLTHTSRHGPLPIVPTAHTSRSNPPLNSSPAPHFALPFQPLAAMGLRAKVEQSAPNRPPTMGEGDVDASILWDWFVKSENFLRHKGTPAADMAKTVAYGMTSVHAIHWLAANGPALPSMDWDTYKDQMRSLFLPTDWEYTARMAVLRLKQGSRPFMDFALDAMGRNNLLAGTTSFMNDDFLRDAIEAGMEPDLAAECHRENTNSITDFRPWLDEVKRLDERRRQRFDEIAKEFARLNIRTTVPGRVPPRLAAAAGALKNADQAAARY
ncbi:hypothetical protein EYR40_007470 [Pleurotus pulmonarius]|nr:hypothetical protein EYR40_007470 [Pleurotus pulmonarius]